MSDETVSCGECGFPMILRVTQKYKYSNGQPRLFWGCSRFPECKGTHGAHPDGAPMGKPADKATQEMRIRAHAAFDNAYRKRNMRRKDAYRWLQRITGLTSDDAHISRFDIEQCQQLIDLIQRIEAGETITAQHPA